MARQTGSNRRSANGSRRAAIYARFSSRFQHSIDDQVRACREWAERNDIDVVSVFSDEAVTGKSSRRRGLHELQEAIDEGRIDVVVIFTTNRLYRKMYQSLRFVEEEIVDRGMRCVFVQSGIDTSDADDWRQRLQLHALIDEFLVQTIGKHVHAAHEGLLLQCRVAGTISFGYSGEVIEGVTTRLGRPARRLIVDEEQSTWVRKIFHWFVDDRLTIRGIVRRLNAEKSPLPPRSSQKRWTRQAVRLLLSNARYIGDWSYGVTKAVWLNKKGYQRQIKRDEPLRQVQIEELRIIDDVLWAKCQERLTKFAHNAGRKSKDGDQTSRPRILNGMLTCQKHQRRLYVGGPFGQYMMCRTCQEEAEPYLYSLLPRELALGLLCDRVASIVTADDSLVSEIMQAVQQFVENAQKPDPGQIEELQRNSDRLSRHIQFVLDSPGETPEDMEENRKRLADLRGQRARFQREITECEAQLNAVIAVPDANGIREEIDRLSEILATAGSSDDPEDIAALTVALETLTGGEITVSQCGERKPKKGWLRLHVNLDVVRQVMRELGISSNGSCSELTIDVREEELTDPDEQTARDLFESEVPINEIAAQLGWNRNRVTKVLKRLYAADGLELPDGRSTRWKRQSSEDLKKVQIAQSAFDQWTSGASLLEIGRSHDVCDMTAKAAVEYWCQQNGLEMPDIDARRPASAEQVVEWLAEGLTLREVADRIGKSIPTVRKWLKDWYAARNLPYPDLRTRRNRDRRDAA